MDLHCNKNKKELVKKIELVFLMNERNVDEPKYVRKHFKKE